jgi:RNA polymerase sigma factor (sigma-70 family)
VSAVAAAPAPADLGSPESYAAELYERHSDTIFRVCLRQLRRREDADDAVQTTFVYALLSLRRGEFPRMELPWLLTIAKNVCSTRRRSGIRRGAYETPQDLDSIQDRLATPERADVASPAELRSALQEIPETQRRALLLREWRGFSYDEIGSELGLSQSATEALLFRARQSVARRLSAGLKALNGLPVLTFVRSLFETGAAKLVAAGVGTALTIAVVPAAQPSPANDPGRMVPRVVPSQSVAHTAPPLVTHHTAQPVQRTTRPARVRPTTVAPPAAPQPSVAPAANVSPGPTTLHTDAPPPAATTPTATVSTPDVGVDGPSLPAVTTPAVTTPEVGGLPPVTVPSVTVEAPQLPKVQLP